MILQVDFNYYKQRKNNYSASSASKTMASIKLIQEAPISLSELKEKLSEIETRDKELSFRANKVKDHLNKLVRLDKKSASELKEKLISLDVPRLKDRQIIKIIDLLPTELDEIRMIFSNETTSISPENMQQILNVVKEYA